MLEIDKILLKNGKEVLKKFINIDENSKNKKHN